MLRSLVLTPSSPAAVAGGEIPSKTGVGAAKTSASAPATLVPAVASAGIDRVDRPSARARHSDVLPRVIPIESYAKHALHGEGAIRRAIYPDLNGSKRLFVGLAEFAPGTSPHVFHRHESEIVGGPGQRRRLTYAPEFEEFYFVVEGTGELQWRLSDGTATSAPMRPGDSVYFPPGVVEHRVFNTGTTTMRVLYGGTPPATIEHLDQEIV